VTNMNCANKIDFMNDSVRSYPSPTGTEVVIKFGQLTINLSPADITALLTSTSIIKHKVLESSKRGKGRSFVMAPTKYVRARGSHWRSICWIKNDNAYGFRISNMYFEVPVKEVESILIELTLISNYSSIH